MNIPAWITGTIKDAGYKMTIPRTQIATFLSEHKGIFCAHDIQKTYKKMDKASIYRSLDLFSRLSLIQPVTSLNGQQYYEMYEHTNHHHHIICTRCQKTQCVSCTIHIPHIKQFNHITHTLILSGVCASCNT